MITTVTGKNQITIPAALARDLDISLGTRLDWTKGESGVLVVKIIPNRAELARRLAGRGRRHLRKGSVPIQDLIKDRVGDGSAAHDRFMWRDIEVGNFPLKLGTLH